MAFLTPRLAPEVRTALRGRWATTRPVERVRGGVVLDSCGELLNTVDGVPGPGGPGWELGSLDELASAVRRAG